MALNWNRKDSDQILYFFFFFHCKSGQALEQIVRGGGGVTIPGGVERSLSDVVQW